MPRRNRIFLFGFGVGAVVTIVLLRQAPLRISALPATSEQLKLIGENLDRTVIYVTSQGVFAGQLPT
jgi:hypothetical protein